MTAAVAALPLIRPITDLRTQFNDAVSYTHLDVYKRQPVRLGARFLRRGRGRRRRAVLPGPGGAHGGIHAGALVNASKRYGSDRPIKVDILFTEDRCMHHKSVFAQCDSCVNACPSHAIHRGEGTSVPLFDPALCLHCGTCLSACPFEAFQATNFSERRALKRMGSDGAVRVRCWLPHGEISALASPVDLSLIHI